MGEKKIVSALVTGGEANAGPPLGPSLGPLGVNVLSIVNMINEKTKDYAGMKVPVKVEVDIDSKKFDVIVGVPPTAALVAKEAGIQKGSGQTGTEFVADVGIDMIVKVAKQKIEGSYAYNMKGAVKEVLGSCVSMGVKVEGKTVREVLQEVDEGKWDGRLK
ncbi:MAG: 50S ribosomal protein L11 [Nitrososphaerales archaeon]